MIAGSQVLAAMITPAMFYAGLACAAIPMVIHLISRRRFRRVRWAATQFLLEANRQNRRRIRIEELILLALRCLTMLLIGMVLARIFVRPQAFAGLLGSRAGTDYVVVLDDSFSMGLADVDSRASTQDTTVFDQALTAVERLVGWLHEECPSDSLAILVTSRPEQTVVAETNLGRLDPVGFSRTWRERKPSSRRADLPEAFAAVRQLLDARRSAGAVIYLVSDFQRIDWLAGESAQATGNGGPGASGSQSDKKLGTAESPLAPLAGWDRADRSLKVVLVDVGSETNDNLAVTGVESRQAQAVAGIGTRLIARVTNFGRSESRACTMQVFVGEVGQPAVTVPAIPAGQSIEVPVEVIFPQVGSAPLTIELQADALPADNRRFCVVPVAKSIRVLLVNGEPSSDPYQDEAFLLSVALRPQGPQFSGNEIAAINEEELEQTDLASFHAVILANVGRVTENAAARLESYVASGGGLAVFLGDQVDVEAYNRVLFCDGTGLLPGRLSEPVAAPNESPGFRVGEMNTSHPALRPFANLMPRCFDGALVWAHFPVAIAPAPATQPSTTNPAQTAVTLLQLDDVDKSPLILQKDHQAGHVWLITSSADKEWNNLPDHPVFVVFAMEMTQHLARRPAQKAMQLVGQPVTLPLDPGRYQPTATVRTPAYPGEPALSVHAEPDTASGGMTIRWVDTEQPGFYQIDLTEQSGAHLVEPVAVNLDGTESNLRRLRRDELQQAVAAWPVEYVRAEELTHGSAAVTRKELWPALLILLVVTLMTEQLLACWFGANRQWSALFGRHGA
jgi:hypothetical protein